MLPMSSPVLFLTLLPPTHKVFCPSSMLVQHEGRFEARLVRVGVSEPI